MSKIAFPYKKIVEVYLDNLIASGSINEKTTIISYGNNPYIKALAEITIGRNIKHINVLLEGTSCEIPSIELLFTPVFLGEKEVKLMAKDMAFELEDGFLIDFVDNKDLSSIIFKNVKLEVTDTVYCEYLSSTEINGLAKILKIKYDSEVIGVSTYAISSNNIDFDLVDKIVTSVDENNVENNLYIEM